MAKWIMGDELNDYVAYLQKLNLATDEIVKESVYQMAKVVADRVRSNIGSLPEKTGVTKKGLEDGFGISPMQNDNGIINVKLGFDGYNQNGVPNALMARVFESGTSTVQKHPFIRPAVKASQKQAIEAGRNTIDKKIQAIIPE